MYCHQATSIWIDFHSVNLLSEGQQEKDAHGVILGVIHQLDWKGQELNLMILVNSVQLKIVYDSTLNRVVSMQCELLPKMKVKTSEGVLREQ